MPQPRHHDDRIANSPAERLLASANGYASCPVEQIFREVAQMKPAPPKDEDPYQSEEYQKFVESMAQYCHCEPACNRPCDGVLAGGLCDGMDWRRDYDCEDA
jgi:hypothetical protein